MANMIGSWRSGLRPKWWLRLRALVPAFDRWCVRRWNEKHPPASRERFGMLMEDEWR